MKKIKYAPKGIPPLTEEQWKQLEEEMDKPMTEKEKEIWRRAKEVYENIKIVIIEPEYVDESFEEQPCGWRHDPEIDCLLCFMKICEEREVLEY